MALYSIYSFVFSLKWSLFLCFFFFFSLSVFYIHLCFTRHAVFVFTRGWNGSFMEFDWKRKVSKEDNNMFHEILMQCSPFTISTLMAFCFNVFCTKCTITSSEESLTESQWEETCNAIFTQLYWMQKSSTFSIHTRVHTALKYCLNGVHYYYYRRGKWSGEILLFECGDEK